MLVLVITTNGMREFVFYVRDEEVAKSTVVVAQRQAGRYDVQHYIELDAEWELYVEFSKEFT